MGMGMGPGMEMGPGPGTAATGPGSGADMMGIHFLFAHRDEIPRTVAQVPRRCSHDHGGGRSGRHGAAAGARAGHVRAPQGGPADQRALIPLFAALFKNADKIDVKIEPTAQGLTVTETSKDANVTKLIRRHAEVVGLFFANGMPEMMQSH